jgi:hypothetical protein
MTKAPSRCLTTSMTFRKNAIPLTSLEKLVIFPSPMSLVGKSPPMLFKADPISKHSRRNPHVNHCGRSTSSSILGTTPLLTITSRTGINLHAMMKFSRRSALKILEDRNSISPRKRRTEKERAPIF